jgi:hypothetical protein
MIGRAAGGAAVARGRNSLCHRLPAFLVPGAYAVDLTQMGEQKITHLDEQQCSIQGIRGSSYRRSIRAIT